MQHPLHLLQVKQILTWTMVSSYMEEYINKYVYEATVNGSYYIVFDNSKQHLIPWCIFFICPEFWHHWGSLFSILKFCISNYNSKSCNVLQWSLSLGKIVDKMNAFVIKGPTLISFKRCLLTWHLHKTLHLRIIQAISTYANQLPASLNINITKPT